MDIQPLTDYALSKVKTEEGLEKISDKNFNFYKNKLKELIHNEKNFFEIKNSKNLEMITKIFFNQTCICYKN